MVDKVVKRIQVHVLFSRSIKSHGWPQPVFIPDAAGLPASVDSDAAAPFRSSCFSPLPVSKEQCAAFPDVLRGCCCGAVSPL